MPAPKPATSCPTPSSHDLRALARRWFERVWNQKNTAAIGEMMTADCVIHGLHEEGQTMSGPAQFRRFYDPFRSAFPDIRVSVEDVLLDGRKTAVRILATGTHTGEGLGIPPTGRPVRASGIVIMRWDDTGRIAEGWNEFDAAGMQRQLAAPAMPVAALRAR